MYLITDGGGALIEPGPASLIPVIRAAIKQLGMSSLAYVIPTHIHLDHAGALGELSRLFPEAKVVVSPEGAKHATDPSKLIQSTRMVFGEGFEEVFGAILPVPESQLIIARDGQRLSLDGRKLIVIHTPGHAPHHIALFDSKEGGLFCGEALGLIYNADTDPLPAAPPPSFNIEEYLDSMERLRQLQPRILFYSHDGIGKDPENLISKAAENTRIVGDAILTALKTEKTEEDIARNVSGYLWRHFGVRLDEFELASNIAGYTIYFRKKGLV